MGEDETNTKVNRIFSGHHGGQVCVPHYGALVTDCDLDTIRAKGLSTHTAGDHTSSLHVSAGMGSSPFAPYRFACRPEVTVLIERQGCRGRGGRPPRPRQR